MVIYTSEGCERQTVPVGPVGCIKCNGVSKVSEIHYSFRISPEDITNRLIFASLNRIKEVWVVSIHLPQVVKKKLNLSFYALLAVVPHIIPTVHFGETNLADATILFDEGGHDSAGTHSCSLKCVNQSLGRARDLPVGTQTVNLVGRNKLMVVVFDKARDKPFTGILHLNREGGFATDSSDGPGTLDLPVLGALFIHISETFFGTDKLPLDDSSITAGAAGGTDTGTKANATGIRVVECLGSFFGLEFKTIIGLEIQEITSLLLLVGKVISRIANKTITARHNWAVEHIIVVESMVLNINSVVINISATTNSVVI